MNNHRVAVIGAGYWGKNLLRNFHQLGALAAICDADSSRLNGYREAYPGIQLQPDFNAILNVPDLPAVAIATPAETHYQLARQAILAGKDVFVEKPLCLQEQEADELVELAQKHGRVLMVGHILHYHPAFIKLQSLIREGELGRVYYIYSNRLNLGRIRREENILWSFAPHDISAILAIAGELPETAVTRGGPYLQAKVADVTVSLLEFKSGLRAHIFVSWLHPVKEQKLVVVGDKKMAVFDDVAPIESKLLLYPHQIEWRNQIPTVHKAQAIPVEIEPDEPLGRECRHFLECIETRSRPVTDGREGRDVLRVLNACQQSLNSGTAVALARSKPADFFVHPTAVVDEPCEIGAGTKIWHFTHVMARSKIGRNCNLGQNVLVSPDVVLGDNVKVQNNVSLYTGVILEDDVFCGPSCVFTNVINPRSHVSRKHEYRQTLVRRGATIGANATIVCGHEIGEYAFIGAGAVVTRDVPAYALMLGVPARQAGWMCQCGERLDVQSSRAACPVCGARYRQEETGSLSREA